MLLLLTDSLTDRRTQTVLRYMGINGERFRRLNVEDSLSQDAARPGDGLAQVHGAFVLNPIGRQIYDLQRRVLLQRLGQVTHAVTSHAVTADNKGAMVRRKQSSSTF